MPDEPSQSGPSSAPRPARPYVAGTYLRVVTHPEVVVDPQRPVTDWELSERGLARARLLLGQQWISAVRRVVSSPERKARQTADVVAGHLGLAVEVRDALGEIDRTATGYLAADRHEQLADALFARPDESAAGWETARVAQRRVLAACSDLLNDDRPGDVLVVGHGGTGTFLYCALAGVAIERRFDQPGQGHYITVDRARRAPLHPWRPIDVITGSPAPRRAPAVEQAGVERAGAAVVAFTGPRLTARRVSADDLDWLDELHHDAAVMAAMGGVRTRSETAAWLTTNLAHWDEHGFGLWVLSEPTEPSTPIGRGGLRWIDDCVGERLVEVGYALGRDSWGRGLATEAARAFVEIAERHYGIDELGAIALVSNVASQRVLIGNGFEPERIVDHRWGPHVFSRRRPPTGDPDGRPRSVASRT